MTTKKRGGYTGPLSPLARPTVKLVTLDDDVATMIRNGCVIRHGTATKADVTQMVNDLLRAALTPKAD
jgi:hypothetical protein